MENNFHFYSITTLFSVHPCDWTHRSACHEHAICNKLEKGETQYECTCKDGYEFAEDGKTCVKGKN